MKRILAAMMLGLPLHPAAQESPAPPPPEPVAWQCWYAAEPADHIACKLLQGHRDPSLEPSAGNLPPLVRTIRDDPSALSEKIVYIPLHSTPVDMAFPARLARAVMCGGKPACEVRFFPSKPEGA